MLQTLIKSYSACTSSLHYCRSADYPSAILAHEVYSGLAPLSAHSISHYSRVTNTSTTSQYMHVLPALLLFSRLPLCIPWLSRIQCTRSTRHPTVFLVLQVLQSYSTCKSFQHYYCSAEHYLSAAIGHQDYSVPEYTSAHSISGDSRATNISTTFQYMRVLLLLPLFSTRSLRTVLGHQGYRVSGYSNSGYSSASNTTTTSQYIPALSILL